MRVFEGDSPYDDSSVALFIDHDNLSMSLRSKFSLDLIVRKANEFGCIKIAKAYYHRMNTAMRRECRKNNIHTVYVNAYPTSDGTRKSLADPTMICDIMEVLFEKTNYTFILVTGDKDFIPVLERIAKKGRKAVVIGPDMNSTANDLIFKTNELGFEFHSYQTLEERFKLEKSRRHIRKR